MPCPEKSLAAKIAAALPCCIPWNDWQRLWHKSISLLHLPTASCTHQLYRDTMRDRFGEAGVEAPTSLTSADFMHCLQTIQNVAPAPALSADQRPTDSDFLAAAIATALLRCISWNDWQRLWGRVVVHSPCPTSVCTYLMYQQTMLSKFPAAGFTDAPAVFPDDFATWFENILRQLPVPASSSPDVSMAPPDELAAALIAALPRCIPWNDWQHLWSKTVARHHLATLPSSMQAFRNSMLQKFPCSSPTAAAPLAPHEAEALLQDISAILTSKTPADEQCPALHANLLELLGKPLTWNQWQRCFAICSACLQHPPAPPNLHASPDVLGSARLCLHRPAALFCIHAACEKVLPFRCARLSRGW
ncbi:unnamed protein product [Cladocopium goreaui]|uniref:Uncharacterized protein n=1 Tax=Cladocopium goreaui TaxID=2562237 RepID=A0A9P1BMA9_9DINO|nr:unnamed protein product [Cladocopium goreaui]